MPEYLYRVHKMYGWGPYIEKFEIVRRTPMSAWVRDSTCLSGLRLVRTSARHPYAWATPEFAFASFIARKDAQARILAKRRDAALEEKQLAEAHLTKLRQSCDTDDAPTKGGDAGNVLSVLTSLPPRS